MGEFDNRKTEDGGNNNEKLEFRGIGSAGATADRVGGKLDNFWFYHKWKVIIGAFFGIVLAICIYQFVTRDVPDIYVMYAGPSYVSAGDVTGMRDAFRSVIDDYNKDGKLGITLTTLTCLTDEQIEKRKQEASAGSQSVDFFIDREANQQNIKQFDMEIFGGESVICLLDPSLYDRVHDAGGFIRMDDIFTDEELNAMKAEGLNMYDGCGVYLNSTRFGKYFSALSELPEDTILCIRKVSTISAFKGKEKYEHLHADHVDAFKKMLSFQYPEGYVTSNQ